MVPIPGSYYSYFDDDTVFKANYTGAVCNINKIVLVDYNLTGKIPSEVGNLRNLTVLHLSFNAISGSIASSLLQLHQLEIMVGNFIDLHKNFFTSRNNLTTCKLIKLTILYNKGHWSE